MYARMCGCMRALVARIPSVRVRARLCMSSRACACARRERRRNPSARPPHVCHYVHIHVGTSTCERMYMHMCVRVDRMQVCAYVRVLPRAAGAAAQPEVATSKCVSLCTYICGYVCAHMYMFASIYRVHVCAYVRVRMCVGARVGSGADARDDKTCTYICVCVSTYVYV